MPRRQAPRETVYHRIETNKHPVLADGRKTVHYGTRNNVECRFIFESKMNLSILAPVYISETGFHHS